jgi:hypothetical protein
LKILFLRAYDFPIGGAPQNRLLGICRGLVEQGYEIEVHQFAPSKLDIPQNLLPNQVYSNVKIFNHAWRWSPARNRFRQLNGIFGFMGYLFILRSIFKPVIRLFDEEFRFYYYLSLISIISLGLIKNLGGRENYIMLLIIIPGLYYYARQREYSKFYYF